MKKIVVLVLGILIITNCSSNKKGFRVQELEYSENVEVIKRADWGWLPLEKTNEEAKISKITIHHGGVEFKSDKDPVQAIRNLQKWSRSGKGWIDIPYHFMIDLEGKIYEARPINFPGDTNTEYNPTGHALVEVMGNYEIQEPSKEQINSLVKLSSFLAKEFNVPISDIKTHKDYSDITVCPGKNIYKYFEDKSIIKMIEEKVKE